MNKLFAALSVSTALCAAPLPAQCLPWAPQPDLPITWTDGYQTEVDIYHPTSPAPAAGWPMVLLVHGGNQSRKHPGIQQLAEKLATNGYVAFAYDYRGEGVTPSLNPAPWVQNELDRTYDSAESFAYVAGLIPGVPTDQGRLAMSGISGGGRHCYRNAAMSGLPLPANGRPALVSPVLAAGAPRATHLDPIEDLVPRGNTIRTYVAVSTYAILPSTDPRHAAVVAYDAAAFAAALRTEVLKDFLPELRQSNVPMLIINAYDDNKHAVSPITAALPTLRPGVQRRLLLTTDGVHSVPGNDTESRLIADSIVRWFDAHVKGTPNGVLLEPTAEAAVSPADVSAYLDPTAEWGHVVEPTWPPALTQTLYLNSIGQLLETPPAIPQPGPVVRHRVDPAYSITQFLIDQGAPSMVIAPNKFRLDRVTFVTTQQNDDLELVGQPVFTAEIDVTAAEYQLHALLHAMPPGGGPARYLSFGAASERNIAPGTRLVTIVMNDMATVIPPGWSLRLTLQNIGLRQTPLAAEIFEMPYFTSTDVTVSIDPASPARLELPARDDIRGHIVPRFGSASAALGIAHPLQVRGGADRIGQPYVVLLGVSGHGPGTLLPGGTHLPLNWDLFTSAALGAAGGGPFTGFVGVLGGPSGMAAGQLTVPAGPLANQLIGLRFTFGVAGIDPAGFWTGGPAVLDIRK